MEAAAILATLALSTLVTLPQPQWESSDRMLLFSSLETLTPSLSIRRMDTCENGLVALLVALLRRLICFTKDRRFRERTAATECTELGAGRTKRGAEMTARQQY